MRSQRFRTLETMNNMEMYFNTEVFQEKCKELQKQKQNEHGKFLKKQLWELISEKANVTTDGVVQWYYGNCSPSDIEIVKELAKLFNVDYHCLLKSDSPNDEMMNADYKSDIPDNLSEKDLIIQVFRAILEFDNTVDPSDKYWANRKGFLEELKRVIYKDALLISNNVLTKLFNITLEYEAYLSANGCDRWMYIDNDPNNFLLNMRELYLDIGIFLVEDEDTEIEKVVEDIASNMYPSYSIKISDKHSVAGYYGNPNDENEIRRYLATFNDEEFKNAESIVEAIDEENQCMLEERCKITVEMAYRWYFVKMLTKVFKHDFPQYFKEMD